MPPVRGTVAVIFRRSPILTIGVRMSESRNGVAPRRIRVCMGVVQTKNVDDALNSDGEVIILLESLPASSARIAYGRAICFEVFEQAY